MLSSFFKKMNNKIILISANNRGNYVQGTFSRENLGLGCLASYLRRTGFELMVIDARLENSSPEDVALKVSKFNPFLIGFSVIAKDGISWCEKTCQVLKEKMKNIPPVCIGSYFPTLQNQSSFGVNALSRFCYYG